MSDLISRKAMLKHIEKIRQGALMMDDTRRASIIMNGMYLCEEAVRNQPSAQPETHEKRTATHACDLISRQWLMECVNEGWIEFDTEKDENIFIHLVRDIAPSAQPEDWMERNKERILQAGMAGREIEFRIGGRLFAIREKAQ